MSVSPAAPRGRVLVAEDEPLKRITLQIDLTEAGFEVLEAIDAAGALRQLQGRPVDVIVADVELPDMPGLDLLTYVRQRHPQVELILMTASASVESAVLAIKRGAFDYLTKPFHSDQLIAKLEVLFARTPPAGADGAINDFAGIRSRNVWMKRVFGLLGEARQSPRPVLLTGEEGSGKRAIADAFARLTCGEGPCEVIDCANGRPAVLEAEMFGGPGRSKSNGKNEHGAFGRSCGGALILENASRLPPLVQHGLAARLSQDGTPLPRIIALTSEPLEQRVESGAFERELYYLLSVRQVEIPPLRARKEDIPLLVDQFIQRHADLVDGRSVRVSTAALEELLRHDWPGNVRELEHVIERALALCTGHEIRPEHIAPLSREHNEPLVSAVRSAEGAPLGLAETVADIERRMIIMALRQCGGNQARAAQKLGVPRTTLRDKMAKYSIAGT